MSNGVRIDPRTVPVPQSISPEAQAMLRRSVNDEGVPLNSLYTLPAADDHDGWRRMQAAVAQQYAASQVGQTAEHVETFTVEDATVYRATPSYGAEFAYIDLHGGALVFGGGENARLAAGKHADLHNLTCYGVDYRMPPDHPYPAALDDCMATYRHVLAHHTPDKIVIGGRSAGGNLAAATVLRARDEGLPLPAALVLLSPEVDLTESGDSFQVNRTVDVVLPNPLMSTNLLYAAGADLSHPYLSPLFGDFAAGFPPTFVQSGTRDLFLSNAVRLHRALRRAEVPVDLHIFEAMPHGGFMGAPEDAELSAEQVRFVRHWLNRA
ncbi:alpha/beta hydrolase [Pseudomonas yamanorum]|uniref:Alpha/beta hydrolase n=1 Tax=Pseudomonas yamanorum TaxID=515393 RepID=A0AAJ3H3K4_9PSED|nr:alpha/beta hydrolase [Pseudomonas yamanorum]AMW83383.1 Esterase/lipase like-protein [Pseudomonas yamanorum]MBV6659391.1 alpha/beta hydrolase [Pseudomonas yamanorum]MDR0189730.1 alpha/beta hydrolase [Pseudomonas yamanorum]NVZ91006.1 alpha/beta hydrolase [Pseudomonas yamanorum]NWD42725.1 alpha/beta hydrolase [Pseudomonas yamanorum]